MRDSPYCKINWRPWNARAADAAITTTGRLKITPLDKAMPDEAEALMQRAHHQLPHLKITELLLEVDDWTGFTGHFQHLKSGTAVDDRHLLLAGHPGRRH